MEGMKIVSQQHISDFNPEHSRILILKDASAE
jgi:hypothetical protein